VKYLGPSFGGINLKDIKAPECFYIEERLREAMDIPVFHDDQHGTAIIAAAGMINAIHLSRVKKSIGSPCCFAEVSTIPQSVASALSVAGSASTARALIAKARPESAA